jgi:hypothetical protein
VEYRTAKGGIKAHVSLDERSMIPDIVNISETKVSDGVEWMISGMKRI